MIETFIALLAAHVAADFLLQFDWIIERKRRWQVFALHLYLVAATAALTLGLWPGGGSDAFFAVAAVTIAHAMLDAVKTWGRAPRWLAGDRDWDVEAYCLDQLGHVIALVAVAAWFPGAFEFGLWALHTPSGGEFVLSGLAMFAGFTIATRGGQFLIAEFMQRFALKETADASDPKTGLKNGGTWIGLLERGLIFGFVIAGQLNAIGFLLAAKSILRFSYAAEDRRHSEYVIIGTLMSFAVGLVAAYGAKALISALNA